MAQSSGSTAQLAVQVVGLSVLVWVAMAVAGIPRDAPPDTATTEAVLIELAEIRSRLQRLEERSSRPIAAPVAPIERPPAAPAERVPVDGPALNTDDIAAEIAALRQDLKSIAARWATAQGGIEAAARWRNADWRSLEAFRGRYKQDSGAKQGLLFLSRTDVLSRFGRPNSVSVDQAGSVIWSYDRRVDGKTQYVRLTFRDGFVISARAR